MQAWQPTCQRQYRLVGLQKAPSEDSHPKTVFLPEEKMVLSMTELCGQLIYTFIALKFKFRQI